MLADIKIAGSMSILVTGSPEYTNMSKQNKLPHSSSRKS